MSTSSVESLSAPPNCLVPLVSFSSFLTAQPRCSTSDAHDELVTRLLGTEGEQEEGEEETTSFLVSTTVRVISSNNIANGETSSICGMFAAPVSMECSRTGEAELLYYLCIVLCVLFSIGCFLNVLFCVCHTSKCGSRASKELASSVPLSADFWIRDDSPRSRPSSFQLEDEAAEMRAAPGVPIPRPQIAEGRDDVSSYASIRVRMHFE